MTGSIARLQRIYMTGPKARVVFFKDDMTPKILVQSLFGRAA